MRRVLKQNFRAHTSWIKRFVFVAMIACIVAIIPVSVAAQGNKSSYVARDSFCNYSSTASNDLRQNPIVKCLNDVVGFLSAGVGIVVVAVVIVGGIQYMTAGDNPQAVTAAKKRIINGLIALAVFMLMFTFLQWLIPGGIFGL
jgi:hypothetical protein